MLQDQMQQGFFQLGIDSLEMIRVRNRPELFAGASRWVIWYISQMDIEQSMIYVPKNRTVILYIRDNMIFIYEIRRFFAKLIWIWLQAGMFPSIWGTLDYFLTGMLMREPSTPKSLPS